MTLGSLGSHDRLGHDRAVPAVRPAMRFVPAEVFKAAWAQALRLTVEDLDAQFSTEPCMRDICRTVFSSCSGWKLVPRSTPGALELHGMPPT